MNHAVTVDNKSVRETVEKYCTKIKGRYPQGVRWIPVEIDGKTDDRYYLKICNDFGRLVCTLMYGCQGLKVFYRAAHRPDSEKVLGLILSRLPKALNGFLEDVFDMSVQGFEKDDSAKGEFGIVMNGEFGSLKIRCLEVYDEIHYHIEMAPRGDFDKMSGEYGEFDIGDGCRSFKEALVRFYADDRRMARAYRKDVLFFIQKLPEKLRAWLALEENNYKISR